MKCPVCFTSWGGESTVCVKCGFDQGAAGANDPAAILKHRDTHKDQTTAYAPESRVSTWDKLKPWVSLLLGFVIFIFWLRACSSMGWRLW